MPSRDRLVSYVPKHRCPVDLSLAQCQHLLPRRESSALPHANKLRKRTFLFQPNRTFLFQTYILPGFSLQISSQRPILNDIHQHIAHLCQRRFVGLLALFIIVGLSALAAEEEEYP